MWKDLSIKEKSQIMNLAVQQGITDLEDIRRAYNDTIDIYDTSSTNTYNNLPQSPSPREVRYDDGGPLGVIVTPDRDYNVFLNSLPDYQKYGTDYNTRRYWELSGKPRDFEEALHLNPPMYNWDKKDHRYHASTVAYNRDNDTYEFMKSPDHPTIDLELLQYWNNPTMADFREKYGLDLYSNPYRYVRRGSTDKKLYAEGGNLFKGGGKKRTLNPQTFANVYDMIKKHEGFYANAYVDGHAKDGTTWYSIGYGTNDSSMHKNLARKYREAGKSISREEAERLMREEVAHVDGTLRRTLGEKAYRALTPGQKMALLDVGYQRPLSMINAAKCLRNGDLAGAERNLFVKQAGDQRNLNRRAAFNGRIGPTDAFPDSHLGSGPAPGRANYDNVVKASEIYSRKPRAFNETVTPTINPYNMDMGELAVNQWFNELLNKRRTEEVAPQELTSNEALASIVSSPRRQPTPIGYETINPIVEAAEQQAIAEKPNVISTIMGIDPYQLANNSDPLLSLGSLTSDYFDTRGLLKNGGRINKFDGGGPRMITTSGSGYIPEARQAQTLDQRRKDFYYKIDPWSRYDDVDVMAKAGLIMSGSPLGKSFANREVHWEDPRTPQVEAIYGKYLNIPVNERYGKTDLKQSSYRPTSGGENIPYYKLQLTNDDKERLVRNAPTVVGRNKVAPVLSDYNLGNSTIGRGLDPQNGEYVSYYDRWDVNPFVGEDSAIWYSLPADTKDITRGIGTPFDLYDRIYLSDYYGVNPMDLVPPSGDYFGGWKPELTVTTKNNRKKK